MRTPAAALLLSALALARAASTTRPIIGILTMPNTDFSAHPRNASFFPASYAKFLESGGARVVPIPFDLPAPALAALLRNINGALFTGGAAAFFDAAGAPTPYARAGAAIYAEVRRAAAAGESWPLWGTCLGHELVAVVAAGAADAAASPLARGFDADNLTLPVAFTPAAGASRLWGGGAAARAAAAAFAGGLAYNSHTQGLAPAAFAAAPQLARDFVITGVSADRAGREFVATMEGRALPVFTTQWHPEKPAYEWNDPALNDIPHTLEAVTANAWPALFFAQQARGNARAFASPAEENAALIYNTAPDFAPARGETEIFEQIYFFPASA